MKKVLAVLFVLVLALAFSTPASAQQQPPQTPQGPQGEPGEVTAQQLTDAIAGTSANSNAVSTLDTPFASDPPTLADMETMRAKMNELINTLRR